MLKIKRCGNCKFCGFENDDCRDICVNPDSDYCGDWVDVEEDNCECFTEKESAI